MIETAKNSILSGDIFLGIELGSTRIKGILIDSTGTPIASGEHDWENQLIDGVWTYSLDDVWAGISDCYASLKADVQEKYSLTLTKIKTIGVSAMMHGYVVLDENDELLVPFRTWRNTMTHEASEKLTELFNFNIPQRWTIAHLYNAILKNETHIPAISKMNSLAGYVHYILTGNFVSGIGDASGIFPTDAETNDYDNSMVNAFDAILASKKIGYKTLDILPKVLVAGDNAGTITKTGAKLLDPSGDLLSGSLMCPPEGDAGTGMVATNSITKRTGNVSAGTSVFAMVVLEKALSKVYSEVDMVTTPTGAPVAMVHCNNCTTDINAWANIFKQFAKEIGVDINLGKILDTIFTSADSSDKNCSGMVNCNYYSGEHLTGFEIGRPLFARLPDSNFTFANFARSNIYSALSTLKLGMDILFINESVKLDKLLGHGGFFKSEFGQKAMANAINVPVSVMSTATEGGAWGMAILASYAANENNVLAFDDYLNEVIFNGSDVKTIIPNEADVNGFNEYIESYKAMLKIEKTAIEVM